MLSTVHWVRYWSSIFFFFFLGVYKFILFRVWLEKLEGWSFRTWKTSIEQNQSQEARCQPNVMKTYPPGLGRLLLTWDESRPRKRKSEVKRNVWWPPNIDAIFLILFLRFSPSKMGNLLSRSNSIRCVIIKSKLKKSLSAAWSFLELKLKNVKEKRRKETLQDILENRDRMCYDII